MSQLTTWDNFYVMIGTAGATLTGLMFVVITLYAGRREVGSDGYGAFATPTIVHFGAALLGAALLSAPWQALWQAGVPLGLCGLGGMAYVAIVVRRTRRLTGYAPVLEDWLWYAVLPLVSYTALAVAAVVLPGNPTPALFVIGAATVLLLFIGIHNAWDAATYNVIVLSQPEDTGQDENSSPAVDGTGT